MKPLKLPKEQREALIREIQDYFEKERGEEIGHLAADGMLDFFMKTASPYIYNQALEDCRGLAVRHMVSLEEDIYALEQKSSSR
ncbi:DUF2164 family protein [Paenibacillus lemnae]|uniref:DUF2164 domain-containing protein n=1 Tax=Paenibacillus lemnae TaxID=1330551 RepID=A0A848M2P3_PAELE|nr:DUF2164 domain-containing protein [Paenibacillus lemnae]